MGVPPARGGQVTVLVPVWWNPRTLLTHLSEKCARQQGRPAKKDTSYPLLEAWEANWCERCSPEEKRIGILEGRQ